MALTVDNTSPIRTMQGFGGAGAFAVPYSTSLADTLWQKSQDGLSIFRSELSTVFSPSIQGWPLTMIGGTPTNGSFQVELQAYERGQRDFLVSCWVNATNTLAAPFPWNTGGGQNASLLASHYDDFATAFTTYCTNFLAAGMPAARLYVSPANEPDITPTYPQTSWTTAQLVTVVRDHLGPALAAWGAARPDWQALSGQTAPQIIVAEPANWANLATWIAAFEADSTALSFVSFYATHQYFGGGASAPPVPCSRPIWETECFDQATSYDPTMTDALDVLGFIYAALTTGTAETWLYWVFQGDNNDTTNGGLVGLVGGVTELTKRSYCLGHFARFVRRGSQLITTSGSPSGVNSLAFRLANGEYAIFCINTNASSTALTVNLTGAPAAFFTPYVTDSTRNMEAQAAIAVSSSSFSTTLASKSLTTFIGGPDASAQGFFGSGTTS